MINRIDCGKTMSRATEHNGVIYFGGHVAAGKQPTMTEQAKALLTRYEELLEMNGTDKDHIIFASIYVTDMNL
ncbi:MAG: RidA family protein, partial [Clostridia bacterium]|nr:RidA family protein [Clostridia bacterium]